MPGTRTPLRIVLLRDRDDMGESIAATLKQLGCALDVQFRHRLPRHHRYSGNDCDVVFAHGPHNGSILEAAATIDFGRPDRPLFVWWLLENLPASHWSPRLLRPAASARLMADRAIRRATGTAIAATNSPIRRALELGHRLRIWGEARWLFRLGCLDGFYIDSAVAAAILNRDGVPSVHLPFGGHEVFGRDLGLTRDIDVLFLGQPGSRRRLRLLRETRSALAARGIDVRVVDGRQGYLDGEARIALLNRSRIVLNIMKEPEDSVGLRFLMAGANGALTVSEPTRALTFLKPGVHYVEAAVDRLPDAVEMYLKDEPARRHLTDQAYDYLRGDGHLSHMIARILADCQRLLADRGGRTVPLPPAARVSGAG